MLYIVTQFPRFTSRLINISNVKTISQNENCEESFWIFDNETMFRVHAYWTEGKVVSLLSIKSAIIEDTGNYTCILPSTEHQVSASLHILKGSSNIFPLVWSEARLVLIGTTFSPMSLLTLLLPERLMSVAEQDKTHIPNIQRAASVCNNVYCGNWHFCWLSCLRLIVHRNSIKTINKLESRACTNLIL